MHEYPITFEIIKIAESYGEKNNGERVVEIGLVIGEDSGFIGDSIEMYFDEIAKETICEGARISIKYVKPKLKCRNCKELFERRLFSFNCPSCGSLGEPTDIGKELYVEYIEINKSGGEE